MSHAAPVIGGWAPDRARDEILQILEIVPDRRAKLYETGSVTGHPLYGESVRAQAEKFTGRVWF
jgi:hypothetical protein